MVPEILKALESVVFITVGLVTLKILSKYT